MSLSSSEEIKAPPRWRMVTLGWAQDPWSHSPLTTIQSEINHPGAPTSYVPMKTLPKPRVWGFCTWTNSLLTWPCSHFSASQSQCFSSFGLTVPVASLGQQKEPLDDIEMRSVCVCVYAKTQLLKEWHNYWGSCSHAFRETNSLRRTMQIVECSLLHWRAQGRVSS